MDKGKHSTKTIMRRGELDCFNDEQRIAIMDMVKEGAITVDEAFAEVKRVRPKQFNVKYLGNGASAIPSSKSDMTEGQGHQALESAMAFIK
jgi:hypothetical protein